MRKMSEEHKQKIRESKIRYYSQFKEQGIKRPYKFNNDTHGNFRYKFNTTDLIEKFNDLQRNFGEINAEIVDSVFKKEKEEKILNNNFF